MLAVSLHSYCSCLSWNIWYSKLGAVSLEITALLSMSSMYIYEAGRYFTHMQIANQVEVKFKSKIWLLNG